MLAEVISIQEQLQEKWLVFWWSLAVGLGIISLAWRQGFFIPLKANPLPYIRGIDVLKGFGFFLFAELLLVPALVVLVFNLGGENLYSSHFLTLQMRGWLNLLIILGGFGAVLIVYFELTATQRRQLWWQTETSWYVHIGTGIIAWFVSYPLVLAFSQGLSLVLWHIFHHPFIEQVAVQHVRHILANPLLFGLTALAIVTLVPVTEEFLFRGLLQTWLKHKFHHTWAAIALSSLVFALFHYSTQQGVTNIELLSSLFLLSCMLGYIYERQRSLWASVGLHGFFNLMSLLMIFQDSTSLHS